MDIVINVAAKVAEYMVAPIIRPIGRHIVRPIARPFINLWEYKSNLENLNKEVEKLEDKRVIVQRFTNDGVEPLPDVKVWLDKATDISNEVSELINQDNPERGCCEGCTYSNLKECYQRRNDVARKLMVVAQHFQDAERSIRSWKDKTNLENLKNEVEKLKDKRDRVQCSIKAGQEPLSKVKRWQDKVNSIIDDVSRLTYKDNVDCKLKEVEQLLQQEAQFSRVATISAETRYKINLENLNKDVATLKLKIESVQLSIEVGEEPLPHVKDWQDKVKKIIDEVSGLPSEHNPEQINQMLKEVAQLLQEEAQFREVSYRPRPKQTYRQPITQHEFSKSRMSILKDIIAALRDADVNMVGIHGMGGVGKTTLAKKVGDQAIQDKLFDEPIFVEVSSSPDIRTIQGVIADHLGLRLTEESVPGRAAKLCDVLKKEEKEEKKILIILDNLWERIKLEEVGIPFGNDCKGLKLLLTARSSDVLTTWMKSQPNFLVEPLGGEDDWTLFKSIAGTCVDFPHLNSVARKVAEKCGGIPLAIVTVATTLGGAKDQSLEKWEEALRKLTNPSPENFEGITKEAYECIKLSYNCLDGDQIKKIFLLCSRMGRTYDASVQDLFRYAFGLGYFDDRFNTMEEARCNVYALVEQLKTASMLLDAPDDFSHPSAVHERFAMHDVICAVARSIASNDRHVFHKLDDHVLYTLKDDNTLKNCTSITLYNIGKLPEDLKLVCPNLEFLSVKAESSYLTIPDNFFIGMSSLLVLHLIRVDLKSRQTSLNCLVNLRTLCLEDGKLGDVVAIGDMNKLEVLSFRGSDIQMLPKELCQLTKLRLLDLTDCYNLSVIPSKVMSCLTGIEALYMNGTSITWEDARPSIDELKHLRHLTTLEICIPEFKMFRGLISSEPKRYKICIGDVTYHWKSRTPYSNISRRFLRLKLDTKEDWIISQLPGVQELELEGDVVGAMNLLDDLGRNGFPQLMYLDVSANNHCVCIVNSVSRAVLPSLESLMVEEMRSLEKICNSPLGADSFLNLKTIHVENCNELSNIFCFFSIVGVPPNLTDIKVLNCENMEEIFAIEEQADGSSAEVVHDIKFSQLSCLRLTNLPKLKSFCCKAKTASPLQLASDTSASQIFSAKELNNHSSLFNEKVATPKLQDLSVYGIQHIEQIWHSLLRPLSSCVQNLTKLRVHVCHNLKELVSSSTAISEESREKEMRETIVFPKLNCLEIEHLRKLTRLCFGYNIEFPSLKKFKMQSCPQFKEFIFDETVATPKLQDLSVHRIQQIKQIWSSSLLPLSSCVQNLTELRVYGCDSLKELVSSSTAISEESREKVRRDTIVFPKLNCLKIEDLAKLIRLCYGYNIEFPSLKEFEIKSCPQFKEFIFDERVATPKLQDLSVHRIQQIKQIWHGLLLPLSSCVQNLTKLRVHGCDSLKELVSSSTAISEESREKEKRDTIVFPKLNCLEIIVLTKLRRLCSGYNIEFPSLEKFEIQSCPQIKEFIFDETVVTPNLQDLYVYGIQQIEQIWHSLLLPLSFCVQNLTKLRVHGCDNLKELISSSTAISEESREKEMRVTMVFPKLNCLEIEDLTKLTKLCSGYNIEFSSLKKFKIRSCPQFKEFIFDETVVTPNLQDLSVYEIQQIEQIWHNLLLPLSSCIQNLTKLRVHRCDNLKELISSSTTISEESRENERRDTIVFPKLNRVEIKYLTKLTRLCSGYNIEFPSLKEFKIENCPQFKESIFDGRTKVPSLEEMRISYMVNLKMIWHNKFTEDSFSKLKSLKVTMSSKLLTVFPSNMCGRMLSLESLNVEDCSSLVQICDLQGINSEEYDHLSFMNLQELKVLNCPSLKYVFAKEGVAAKEVPAKFVFPKLTSLELYHLPKLGTFYPGKHTVEGPILKRLELFDCGIHYTDEEGQTQQPLYLVQQLVFPCLEGLKLTGEQLTMMGQVQVPEYLFHKVKILEVWGRESTVFPPDIIQRCQNLEQLLLIGDIFFCGEDRTQAAPLAKVKTLVLQNLQDMKYMWEQDSIWDLIFQNLEVLTVVTCNSLVNLMPPSASFQNLTMLDVSSCERLETIVTSSMAKSLMKLETMCISHCPKITEVMQNHGEATEKIIFSNLKTLLLIQAGNLTSFCSCNFTLEFPSLEILQVHSCRNMKTFSQGNLTMPKLQEVTINKESFRLRPDTNLNTIIQRFHAERHSTKIEQGCSSSQLMEWGHMSFV